MAKRPAAKTEEVRPVDQLREEPPALTREQLEAELARLDQEEAERQPAPVAAEPRPGGCLMVFLVVGFVLMFGWMVYREFRGDSQPAPPPPFPGPAPAPQVDLRAYTQPLAAKLAYDPEKAKRVRDIYAGFRDALSGPGGKRVANSGVLETIQEALLQDLNAKGGTPVGAEIDQAIGGYLGITKATDEEGGWEPKEFTDQDRQKLVQIVGAISQAGAEAL